MSRIPEVPFVIEPTQRQPGPAALVPGPVLTSFAVGGQRVLFVADLREVAAYVTAPESFESTEVVFRGGAKVVVPIALQRFHELVVEAMGVLPGR